MPLSSTRKFPSAVVFLVPITIPEEDAWVAAIVPEGAAGVPVETIGVPVLAGADVAVLTAGEVGAEVLTAAGVPVAPVTGIAAVGEAAGAQAARASDKTIRKVPNRET